MLKALFVIISKNKCIFNFHICMNVCGHFYIYIYIERERDTHTHWIFDLCFIAGHKNLFKK
jgi:hypothetical protein